MLHAAGAVTPWQAIALEQWVNFGTATLPDDAPNPLKKVQVATLNRQSVLVAFGLTEEALGQLRRHIREQNVGVEDLAEPLDEESFWDGALAHFDGDSDLD